METDAISRGAVHVVINSRVFDTEYPSEFDELCRMIDDSPALDVAPVVRCGECKYMKERHYEGPGEPPYIKRTCGSKYGLSKPYTVEEWDFCSRGELKEGEEDD